MKWLILLCACASAHAGVLVEAKLPNGATIYLHDSVGACVDGAKEALWVNSDGSVKIPGCYKIKPDDGAVSLGWMDGDGSTVPIPFFKRPATVPSV